MVSMICFKIFFLHVFSCILGCIFYFLDFFLNILRQKKPLLKDHNHIHFAVVGQYEIYLENVGHKAVSNRFHDIFPMIQNLNYQKRD